MTDDPKKSARPLDSVLPDLNPEEASRIVEIWDLLGPDETNPYENPRLKESHWQRLEEAIDREVVEEEVVRRDSSNHRKTSQAADRESAPAHHTRCRKMVGWSAAFITVCLIGVWVYGLMSVEHHALPGERPRIQLPDGTEIDLNSGSSIRYRRWSGDVRRVFLDGEAFFNVKRNHRPFVAETFNASIQVVGTRFNIRSRPEETDPATIVSVEEGSVRFEPLGKPEAGILLERGENGRLEAHRSPDKPRLFKDWPVTDAIAWRNGDLVFRNEALESIIHEVERRYGIQIHLTHDDLRQKRMNLALRNPSGAEAVLQDLATALGLQFRPVVDGFELGPTSP